MKSLAIFLLATAAYAAVSGTVVNRTSGAPQPKAKVTLFQFGTGAMEPVASVDTDSAGAFSFTQSIPAGRPGIIRVTWQGVTFNQMIPPGTPSTGITVNISDVTKKPDAVKVSKHMILLEPAAGKLAISETLLVENTGKTTWFDPATGQVRFYLPKGAEGLDVRARAPDSNVAVMSPVGEIAADVRASKFEIKPGTTQIDVSYQVPYTAGDPYKGKVPSDDENTYLITPNGINIDGKDLSDMGTEPKTQAHIYGLRGKSYEVKLTGEAAPLPTESASAQEGGDNDGSPPVEPILPRIFRHAGWILGFSFGILALGFALLYRTRVPEEFNERGRR